MDLWLKRTPGKSRLGLILAGCSVRRWKVTFPRAASELVPLWSADFRHGFDFLAETGFLWNYDVPEVLYFACHSEKPTIPGDTVHTRDGVPYPGRKPGQSSKTERACSQVEFHFSVLLGSDKCFEELSSLAANRDISCPHACKRLFCLCAWEIRGIFCISAAGGLQDCWCCLFLLPSLRPMTITNNGNGHDSDNQQPFACICYVPGNVISSFYVHNNLLKYVR